MLVRVGVILLLLAGLPAAAQERAVSDDDVNAIARQMYCPVCENIPLDVCPTAACVQWRGEIRVQLEQGREGEEIIADFVQRFGDRVVGTPQDPTLRALSLVTPWVIGLAAVAAALVIFMRWRQSHPLANAPQAAGEATKTDDIYRARLEHDVKTRR